MIVNGLSFENIHVATKFYSTCSVIAEEFSRLYCVKEKDLYGVILGRTSNLIKDYDVNVSKQVLQECDILLDLIWETINIGHWKNVDVFWRQLYRSICFIKSVNLSWDDRISEAILSCDMGLIMGAPFGEELFVQELADFLSQYVSIDSLCETEHEPVGKAEVPLPFLTNHKEIPQVNAPSLEKFIELLKPSTPFIMKNVIDHWPAMKKWSPSYLIQNHGERTVPIEIGSSYTSEQWSQKLLKLKDFIRTYMLKSSNEVAYLAQYELFNHITKLKDDITPLDYCAVSESDVVTNCWFGPEGTISPLHHDHYQNLFCQVYGYKRFIMFASHDNMHSHQHHLLKNTSQIDVESPNAIRDFPDFADKTAWIADLGPGDVLYLPLHWWHHVRSLSVSFSVSLWWKK